MKGCKIRSGFRVISNNMSDGHLHCWYFPTLDEANNFAKGLSEESGREADVLKYLGSWRRAQPPIEFVPSED